MARAAPQAERSLAELQSLLRSFGAPPHARLAMTRTVPDDLARPGVSMLSLSRPEQVALKQAVADVAADLRFEHLDRQVDDAVWRFACRAALDRDRDQVPGFCREYVVTPEQRTCFLPVEGLSVDKPRELPGGTLLPVDHPEVPPEGFGFRLEPPVGSILAVPVEGTHLRRMAERASAASDHALRILRAALREHRSIPNEQLRFRRDIGYSFGDGLAGWKRAADDIIEVGINDELDALARSSPLWRIHQQPRTDVERKAALALQWIERGQFATDPVESLLFYFFALEALLGDKSEKLKGQAMALRRAMLSVAVSETFTDPDRVYFLYDSVRSAAVHGEVPPEIDTKTVNAFAWDVRSALIEYLTFAEAEGIARRGRLLRALETHPRRDELATWLREFGGSWWHEPTPPST